MKKLLLITVLAVFGFSNVNGQDIQFGAKIGANFSTINGDTPDNTEWITSIINFGIYAEIPLNEKFSFQPEVMYSRQGFSIGEEILSLDYLNVPLMGKYYLTKGLSLEAGPQIGFLLSANDEGVNVKNNFKTLDFGVNLGLGYKLNNGLNFGARYNLGLSNINNIEGSNATIRNTTIQVIIGYSFF